MLLAMHPRLRRALVLGLGLMLLGGLLLSGGVHAVVHADDAAPCDACSLASVTPFEPVLELDPFSFVRIPREVAPAAPPAKTAVRARRSRAPPQAA